MQTYEQTAAFLAAIGVQPGASHVKKCVKCHEIKNHAEFGKCKNSKDGLTSQCRYCHNLNQKIKRDLSLKSSLDILEKKQYDTKRYFARHHLTFSDPYTRAKRLFNCAKYRAKQKGIEFSVCFARVHVALMIGKCEKSGIIFDLEVSNKESRKAFSPSIDRIDNNKGYTEENTQIVCTAYNLGKGPFSEEEFIKLCIAVSENQKAGNANAEF